MALPASFAKYNPASLSHFNYDLAHVSSLPTHIYCHSYICSYKPYIYKHLFLHLIRIYECGMHFCCLFLLKKAKKIIVAAIFSLFGKEKNCAEQKSPELKQGFPLFAFFVSRIFFTIDFGETPSS